MKKDFESIIRDLNAKASDIAMDNEEITKLIQDVKLKIENNHMLSGLVEDIKESIEMIISWKDGEYTQLSKNTVLLVLGGLIYIADPFGIKPKFLKNSLLSEVLVIIYILKKSKEELEEYKKWKSNQIEHRDNGEEDTTVYIEL